MSLRESDSTIDGLLRQALQPLAEAEPPATVWRRIVNAVPTTPWSRWSRLSMWARGFANVFYWPALSSQPYCDESGRKCHPAPSVGLMGKQVFDLRLAF
jgi:hypothetical protein